MSVRPVDELLAAAIVWSVTDDALHRLLRLCAARRVRCHEADRVAIEQLLELVGAELERRGRAAAELAELRALPAPRPAETMY